VESHVSQRARDMGHPRFVWASANSRFLTGLSARFGMTKVLGACGTTEVVPFPVVALPKILERWGRGIPRLAKGARHGAPMVCGAASKKQVRHRAFSPVRNDKIFVRASRRD